MKINHLSRFATCLALVSMAISAAKVSAQEAAATTPDQTAPAAPAAPQLGYGSAQILHLAQAKVSDDTIIAFIKNSGNSYALSADQIIYLQQQGLSSAVLNTMLNQPKTGGLAYLPPAAMPAAMPAARADSTTDSQPAYDSAPATSTVSVGPAVTAIDPTAAAAYTAYNYPYYPYAYYYPAYAYYGCYPGVSVSIGWSGYGWRGGGYRGGNFRGGGFHGGVHR